VRNATVCCIVACVVTTSTGRASEQPVPVGAGLGVFFDQYLIERMEGAVLKLHSPVPRGTVFTFDKPWEGGQSGYVTLLKDADQYRMYYRGGGDLGREYTCVAFSADGVTWTRPSLGLFEFEGSRDNNIIWTGPEKSYSESHNFSPFIDANPTCRPDQRYKAVSLSKTGPPGGDRRKVLYAFASSDGLHWRRLGDDPIIVEGAFDSHNTAFWDTVQKQYVCYLRQTQQGKRSIARATSADFVHWSRPVLLDFGATPIEHFYTNAILPYPREPRVYIGLPMRFVPPTERNRVGLDQRETDGLSDAVFMSSHDGLRWNRTFLEAWIRPGLDPKNWGGAHGNQMPAWGVLQTGPTELSVYWTDHYDNYPAKELIPRLQRGTLRLDGFVSVSAPYGGGRMLTKPAVFEGRRLAINVSTSAVGSVKVEIQDASGTPFPGYGIEDCIEIWGDEIERVVAWKAGADVSKLSGRPIRLHFVLKDADLYAVRFLP